MSGITPEWARSMAEWLVAQHPEVIRTVFPIEAASFTPGERLYADVCPRGAPFWSGLSGDERSVYEDAAAAVIAHYVGPDRVVVDRVDVAYVTGGAFDLAQRGGAEGRLREALS